MSTPNPNTLDPAEIVKLPMRRNVPLNGLTREQVIALGHDPDEIEAGWLIAREGQQQEARLVEAQILAAAHQTVAEGNLTYAEAADALHAAGFHAAHAVLVQQWQEEEGWYAAQEAAEELAYLDAEGY